MKLREIFRFELSYQLRRVLTWLYFGVLAVVAFNSIRGNYISDARHGDFLLNSPFVIAATTVLASLLWVLMAGAVAGNAAARDVQTRMHPLTYTAPVSKAEYLGGRFLAAFVLNVLLLLAVPVGILLGVHLPGVEPEILGPFRPASYLNAYFLIALPTAFATTAIQFSLAALSRRAIAAYLGSLVLFVTTYLVAGGIAEPLHMPTLGHLLDPIGMVTVVGYLSKAWTPIEKNTLLIGLEGSTLLNRLVWIGIGLSVLAFAHRRFRFGHPDASPRPGRRARRRDGHAPAAEGTAIVRGTRIAVLQVRPSFTFATHARQTLAIARRSFRTVVRSRSGLVLLAPIATLAGLYVLGHMKFMGVPLVPRTDHVLAFLTGPLTDPRSGWVIIPLLTVFYAGEVVWREREAGLGEIADAAPVPEWALFVGAFLGLGLVLVSWETLLTTVGVLVQVGMGYRGVQIGRYLQILFGLQLTDYLLFAVLALVVHALVSDKHVGYLVALLAYGFIAFASAFGIQHSLLIYGADPGWSYTDMRGFGPSLGPWLSFKLYWAAWALLLAVVARLLWVRGREVDLGARLRMARRRLTHPTKWAAAVAVVLILSLGGFIFYNTNVLNAYSTASERSERRTEYQRRYGRYEHVPQPQVTGTDLNVEIYPERREVEIRGTYRLVNRSGAAVDSIHLSTAPDVETGTVSFDRPAARVLADEHFGYRIYALKRPLQPGDSVRMSFVVRSEPHGFRNRGMAAFVAENGTYFTNRDWLPALGYQPDRALDDKGGRPATGIGSRPAIPSLYDVRARQEMTTAAEWITFDAVVGTDEDQTAVAPGLLRRTWTEGGRRYFRYSTDAPIQNRYAFFSADYAAREAQWQGVAIQIFHDPRHTANLDRIIEGTRASLSYYTEQFGPYPYPYIRFVERPSQGFGMHSEAANIAYDEGFSLLNPGRDSEGADLPFAVAAHEVAHQWWGNQLAYAPVEGAALLTESLATYCAMQVVEETYGEEHLRRYLNLLRTAYEMPRTRAGVPLLRATDSFDAYRRGPFALYALSEYIGKARIYEALRRLLDEYGSRGPPSPTSLDLYRHLQAVTPDSLQSLVHDLFAANTHWDLETKRATARQTPTGTWQVTLDVRARKMVVDTAGIETPVPMDDWVEIGVFAPAEKGNGTGKPLYLQTHRIGPGEHTITVTVPRKPVLAGVDPRHLLTDLPRDDHLAEVKIER